MPTLMQLHVFYKNDLPEGFGVGLDEEFFIDNPEAQDNFVRCSQLSIDEFKKQKTDRAKQEFIADIQEQFAEVCAWMIEHKGQALDKDWMMYFVILLDDMTFLQSLDLFPNDEYNGPQWVWFKE